eukprot:TRINITY_DN7416_c0_g3_i2.p1 TRINITY_DN7416_c0_g3~~TRINITY_DN7416_c0_g3_i2.p1  ORF type:complete len:680 (+),score=189.58 TRINITY_DN7416_c0_g3_i2:60-2099(+)
MKTLLLVTLLCSVLCYTLAAAPSDYFSTTDATSVKQLISSTLSSDKQSYGSITETHYAVTSLLLLGETKATITNAAALCTYAKQFITATESVTNLYHAIHVVESLSCGDKVSPAVVDRIETGLQQALHIKYEAVETLTLLKKTGHATFDDADLIAAATDVLKLAQDDGTFKASSKKEEEGTALNAGYAYNILSKISLTPEQQKTLEDKVLPRVDDLLAAAEEDDIVVFGDDALTQLQTTGLIFQGLNALAVGDDTSVDLTEDQIVAFAEFFIRNKQVSTVKDAFYLLQGLQSVASNTFHLPLVLTLPQASVVLSKKAGESGLVKVRVTDIFGRPATAARVYLANAFPIANEKEILLRNQEALAESNNPTYYSFNFLAAKPEPGYYSLEFSVTPSGKDNKYFAVTEVVKNIKVIAAVEITDVSVHVADSRDEDEYQMTRFNPKYPETIKEDIHVNLLQHILIGFRVKNVLSQKLVKVYQAFIRFRNEATGDELTYTIKYDRKYEFNMAVQSAVKDFKGKTGRYVVSILVGDPFVQNAVEWNVAKVVLNFGKLEAQYNSTAAPKKGQVLPEIYHQFRKPEKRPDQFFSLIFTAAVLSPLLILIIGLLSVGVNLGSLPGGLGFLYSFGFQICIGSIFGLYAYYWFYLNILQTLGYLALLSVPTILLGLKALQGVYRVRVTKN